MISARFMFLTWASYSARDEPEQGAREARARNAQEDQSGDSLASDKALSKPGC